MGHPERFSTKCFGIRARRTSNQNVASAAKADLEGPLFGWAEAQPSEILARMKQSFYRFDRRAGLQPGRDGPAFAGFSR